MRNFEYQCPTKIIFGKNEITKLPSLLNKSDKILLIYGGGSIKKNGIYNTVTDLLKDFDWLEFGGIEANPDFETCLKATDFAKDNKVTFLLAVGGGSVVDATKFIAQCVYETGDAWELLDGTRVANRALGLGAIMTLPATGSEMNRGGVISRRSTGEKRSFHNDLVFPKFSIIDPAFTFTLPSNQLKNGIIDSFVHTIEQYATFDVNTPLQDSWAIGLMKTIMQEGVKTLQNPDDYDARANLCWCATCALNYWIGLGVVQDWAVHAIGHELTALYGIDHAQSLAIVLPSRYKLALNQKSSKLAKLGTEAFKLSGDDLSVARECIDKIEEFFRLLGVKTRLSEYGIDTHKTAEQIYERFSKRGINYGENKEVTPDIARKIILLAK